MSTHSHQHTDSPKDQTLDRTVHSLDNRPIKLALYGGSGRMGKQVQDLLHDQPQWELTLLCNRNEVLVYPNSKQPKGYPLSQLSTHLNQCDVLLDFSQASAFPTLLDHLKDHPLLPCVSGVTGLDQELLDRFQSRSLYAPTFYAPNFSIGVALTQKLAQLTAQWLGGEYDVEIYELHHRYKKDAPSGTALALGQSVKEGYEATTLQISAGRGGHVIGDHHIHFLGDADRIEITHRALDRSLFARGALKASQWLLNQPPGWYTVHDLWNH